MADWRLTKERSPPIISGAFSNFCLLPFYVSGLAFHVSRFVGGVCLCATLLCACTPETDKSTVTIFAAASLSTALTQITEAYEKENPEREIRLNFAASSMLARQIEQGAAADIYFSANTEWMDYLERKGFILSDTRQSFLTNKLVVISSKSAQVQIIRIEDLLHENIQKITLADWSHVPAGLYARQMFKKADIWSKIKKKCLPALDTRAALAYVERGDVDFGVVYQSDALISKKVRIILIPPDSLQPQISCPVTMLDEPEKENARFFFEFLQSPTARKIFVRNGFSWFNPDEGKQ